MVYRGTWGRDPEKKGEDVFPGFTLLYSISELVPEYNNASSFGGSEEPHFREIADFRGIPPRMYYRLVPRLLPS